jgi:Arm domain-containing DNA-binding protein
MKLTKSSLAALKIAQGKGDQFIWDDDLPGFGIRLRGDTARWVVQYRIGAQQRRESLGDIRKVELEDARKIAKNRFAQAELGTDPAAEKAKARAAEAAKLTLEKVVSRYLAAKVRVVRANTYNQSKLHLSNIGGHLRIGRLIASRGLMWPRDCKSLPLSAAAPPLDEPEEIYPLCSVGQSGKDFAIAIRF